MNGWFGGGGYRVVEGGCKEATRMQPAGGRMPPASRLSRYFVQIEMAGQDLGELLVKHGWARAKPSLFYRTANQPRIAWRSWKIRNRSPEKEARHLGQFDQGVEVISKFREFRARTSRAFVATKYRNVSPRHHSGQFRTQKINSRRRSKREYSSLYDSTRETLPILDT